METQSSAHTIPAQPPDRGETVRPVTPEDFARAATHYRGLADDLEAEAMLAKANEQMACVFCGGDHLAQNCTLDGRDESGPTVGQLALETAGILAASLNTIITEATGCRATQIILHAHEIPAERWHALTQPLVVMPSKERPTAVAKRIELTGGYTVNAWCSHDRDACPDLVAAQAAFDTAAQLAVADAWKFTLAQDAAS